MWLVIIGSIVAIGCYTVAWILEYVVIPHMIRKAKTLAYSGRSLTKNGYLEFTKNPTVN